MLDREILADVAGDFVDIAVVILKGMLFNSKRDHTDGVVQYVRKFYVEKLEQILSSGDDKLIDLKADITQILEYIAENKERFNIYWKAWKRCAVEIRDDNQYSRSITSFVKILETADPEYKYSIRDELYQLIDSSDPIIAKRAKGMHSLLFG